MTWEADGVLSLELGRDDHGDLPSFDPGAHIDLILKPDLIRQYSLCSDPSARSRWSPDNEESRPRAALSQEVPAATYSPTQLPGQYHRRWRA
jgi:hypothetical protein